MKDYTLSEISDICVEMCNSRSLKEIPCKSCKMQEICKTLNWQKYHRGFSPNNWDIEPRDMIELPCKQEIKFSEERSEWQVVWRDDFIQRIRFADFTTESEADEFWAKLKGGKK